MFCKQCGKIISADTNYCPNCGFNNSTSSHNNSYLPQRTKSEFISQYHKEHSGYYIALVFYIIFIVIGALIALMNINNISTIFSRYASDSSKFRAIIPFIISVVFEISAYGFMAVAKSKDREAQNEYERYISMFGHRTSQTPHTCVTKTPVNNNNGEWICPNCGKTHQHYVGTCGCGTQKPK